MRPESGSTLEERVARLEQSLAELSERLGSTSSAAPHQATPELPGWYRSPLTPDSAVDPEERRGRSAVSAPPVSAPPGRQQPASNRPNPFATKSVEWWLARGGAVLTSVALILLYQYAVERNWITPLIRVLTGTAVGGALMISASKLTKRNAGAADVIGLREVLLGAALAAWYITAYAAAVFYQLIPFSAARLLFLALTILGAWLALSERRAILALLALGVGFSTPELLPSATPSIPAFALFLAALSTVGLVLYLMRGWQSVLWLTFVAFWWSAFSATAFINPRLTGSLDSARIAMSLLVIASAAAMTRVPVLRRKLLAIGSDRYTEPPRSNLTESVPKNLGAFVQLITGYGKATALDSAAVWVISLSSPLLALVYLQWIWTSVPAVAWGIASILLASLAYRLASSHQSADDEITHVAATATALFSLAGALWIADALGNRFLPSSATILIAASLHALVTLYYLKASQFVTARRVGLWTAYVALASTILTEVVMPGAGANAVGLGGTLAELTAIGVSMWIWRIFREQQASSMFPGWFGIGAYIALMLVDARVLGDIWPPLVTASYAIAGTALLVAARGRAEARALRRLGGFTLIVVVLRLMMVDLAGVATIWKVLLFLGCGALFLFTSHVLQTPRESPEPAG